MQLWEMQESEHTDLRQGGQHCRQAQPRREGSLLLRLPMKYNWTEFNKLFYHEPCHAQLNQQLAQFTCQSFQLHLAMVPSNNWVNNPYHLLVVTFESHRNFFWNIISDNPAQVSPCFQCLLVTCLIPLCSYLLLILKELSTISSLAFMV